MSEDKKDVDNTIEPTGHEQDSSRIESRQSGYSRNNKISDIFNRPDTKPVIIQTAGIFCAVGVTYGLFGLFAAGQLPSGGGIAGAAGGALVVGMIALIASLVGPVISLITTIRTDQTLSHLNDNIKYATHASGSAIGQFGLMIIAITLVSSSASAVGIGDLFNLILISAIITGLTAAICSFVLQKSAAPTTP
jgi:hypothetical protein